jgi:aminoglycoside phosphotransferase (APT) family kinase protein
VTAPTVPAELASGVQRLASDHLIGRSHRVVRTSVEPAHGHSGRTWRVSMLDATGATRRFALRLGPSGVPRRGTADLVRQAGYLAAARRHGVPAPAVVAAGDGPPWFDVAFHLTEWVTGETVDDWSAAAADLPSDTFRQRLDRAVDALATLQRVPIGAVPGGDRPRTPADEVSHWRDLAVRVGDDPTRHAIGTRARELLATAPPGEGPVVVHGDFRMGNLVVAGDDVRAVLDWEVAGTGSPQLDLAWLLLFADSADWFGQGHRLDTRTRDAVVLRWERATGRRAEHLRWFDGLAGLRYAAIVAFNHHLHVTGRRPDPLWDEMIRRTPHLLARVAA